MGVSADNPTKGIGEKQVLLCSYELFVAVSHVEIYHAVALVGPYNGKIAVLYYVFDAEWIVLFRQ